MSNDDNPSTVTTRTTGNRFEKTVPLLESPLASLAGSKGVQGDTLCTQFHHFMVPPSILAASTRCKYLISIHTHSKYTHQGAKRYSQQIQHKHLSFITHVKSTCFLQFRFRNLVRKTGGLVLPKVSKQMVYSRCVDATPRTKHGDNSATLCSVHK